MSPYLQEMFREFSAIVDQYRDDRAIMARIRAEIAVRDKILSALRKEFKRLGAQVPA